jgi:hypothetical protein
LLGGVNTTSREKGLKARKLQAFRVLCEQFVAKTQTEPKCLYYGFSFSEPERIAVRAPSWRACARREAERWR